MTKIYFAIRLFLATLSVALIMSGCASSGGIKDLIPVLWGSGT